MNSFLGAFPTLSIKAPRRKVFISYHGGDREEANRFIGRWTMEDVFIPKTIGLSDLENFIESSDTNYVMGQIRCRYLEDSTVTIVLIGSCTHSRRFVDWEIKASLRRGDVYTPNGLIGILLPSAGGSAHLPERFARNYNSAPLLNCYARFYNPPNFAFELSRWIEDAFQARTTRVNLIQNAADMMKYNAKCQHCGVTH